MHNTKVGLAGKTPAVRQKPIDPNQPRKIKVLSEKEKYEKMWTVADYRKVAPGEHAAQGFMQIASPKAGEDVIDFGCGTGRGAFWLTFMGNLTVTGLDFASNCLDDDVRMSMDNYPEKIKFIEHDLNDASPVKAKYGYCTDVMEHIPTDQVDTVLENIIESAQSVYFRISTEPDYFGPKCLRQPLHLTVKSYAWWAKKFLEHDTIIMHSKDHGGMVDFYVTGWSKELPSSVNLNTSEEKILSNIRENAKFGCRHVRPHMIQEEAEVIVLCGGPSLNDYEDEIIEAHKNGTKVVTVNGAYNWAQERGIHNVNQCVIDARPFNKRFVEPPRDDCYYFIASQCDPSVFEALSPERTFYWHCTTSDAAVDILEECYPEFVVCGGGSTVMLRALVLLRTLGFKRLKIYGFDSCARDEDHHAYEQKENDTKLEMAPVTVGGRTFLCQRWMVYQAFEFLDMVRIMGDEFSLDVKGDGLIAHILKTGASLPPIEEV
jgi:SAM-dependent methyltransferase